LKQVELRSDTALNRSSSASSEHLGYREEYLLSVSWLRDGTPGQTHPVATFCTPAGQAFNCYTHGLRDDVNLGFFGQSASRIHLNCNYTDFSSLVRQLTQYKTTQRKDVVGARRGRARSPVSGGR